MGLAHRVRASAALAATNFEFGFLDFSERFGAPGDAGNFVETVRDIIEATGLKPSRLELEITERLLIRNDASIAAALNQLTEAGIRLAIDDFGTGYSALSYLKEFPFDVLKIDRSFVDDVMRDQESAGLTRSIIMMAHSLGLEVIAEGIEDHDQLSFLRQHKCELGQGFGLGRPMPAEQFSALIANTAGDPAPRYPLLENQAILAV